MTEKYRKKPVEVEVIKFDRDKWIKEESQENETYPMVVATIASGFKTIPVIETLEGDMKVSDGDYIIKGVHGEFYPCKPDIFHETYEPVSDHQQTFEVGEYYSYSNSYESFIFKILKISKHYYKTLELSSGSKRLEKNQFNYDSTFAKHSKPATAEEIAEFKRAEHFASKGRKLDEFEIYDEVYDELHGIGKVIATDTAGEVTVGYTYSIGTKKYSYGKGAYDQLELIQTAEELREVGE